MENANIVVFEDDTFLREAFGPLATAEGHSVIAEAGNLADALSVVDRIISNEILADVIVLDGNLGFTDKSGNDAREIIKALKPAADRIKIVGFSSLSMAEYGLNVHAESGKSVTKVLKAIDNF